jgi:hypothetical protein
MSNKCLSNVSLFADKDTYETENRTNYINTDFDSELFILTSNRKLKVIKGDFAIPDDDEKGSNLIIYPTSPKAVRPKTKMSLFNELANMDIGIMKEREMTPQRTKEDNNENNGIVRTNSFSKENMEKIRSTIVPLNKKYHIKSNKDSIIKVPEGCKYLNNFLDETDDHDLKFFIDLINEEPVKLNGWNQVINEKMLGIYKKTVRYIIIF